MQIRSISEAITASSVETWSVTVRVFLKRWLLGRLIECCLRMIWRLPINREANSAVPPCSLAEQRRMRVFPQFSVML